MTPQELESNRLDILNNWLPLGNAVLSFKTSSNPELWQNNLGFLKTLLPERLEAYMRIKYQRSHNADHIIQTLLDALGSDFTTAHDAEVTRMHSWVTGHSADVGYLSLDDVKELVGIYSRIFLLTKGTLGDFENHDTMLQRYGAIQAALWGRKTD